MEFEERAAMGYCEEGDVELLGFVVELGLDVHADRTCAFI